MFSSIVSKYDPGIFIGKNIAAYIKYEPLEIKIATFVHAIFAGLIVLFASPFSTLPLLKIGILAVGASLSFLFLIAFMRGQDLRKNPES